MPGSTDELDDDSPVPLHRQLAAILRDQIESGELTGRLPSEWTLSQRYGISRGTARRALADLVEEGLAESSQGRGTFVRKT